MKMIFEAPEVGVLRFTAADIIATSDFPIPPVDETTGGNFENEGDRVP